MPETKLKSLQQARDYLAQLDNVDKGQLPSNEEKFIRRYAIAEVQKQGYEVPFDYNNYDYTDSLSAELYKATVSPVAEGFLGLWNAIPSVLAAVLAFPTTTSQAATSYMNDLLEKITGEDYDDPEVQERHSHGGFLSYDPAAKGSASITNAINDFFDKWKWKGSEAARQPLNIKNFWETANPNNVAYTVGNGLGSVIGFLGSIAITKKFAGAKGASLAKMDFPTFLGSYIFMNNELYNEFRTKAKIPDANAAKLASIVSIPVAVSEFMGLSLIGRVVSNPVKKSLLKETIEETVKTYAGKQIPKELYQDFVAKSITGINKRIGNVMLKGGESALIEGTEELVQGKMQQVGEQIYDILADKKVFGTDAFDKKALKEDVNNAFWGGVIGAILGGGGSALNSEYAEESMFKYVGDNLRRGNTTKIDGLKTYIKQLQDKGKLDAETATKGVQMVDDMVSLHNEKMPKTLTNTDARYQAYDLIQRRNAIQNRLSELESEDVDPVLAVADDPARQTLEDQVKAYNFAIFEIANTKAPIDETKLNTEIAEIIKKYQPVQEPKTKPNEQPQEEVPLPQEEAASVAAGEEQPYNDHLPDFDNDISQQQNPEQDAIQIEGSEGVDAHTSSGNSEALGLRNAEGEKIAEEGTSQEVEQPQQEALEPPPFRYNPEKYEYVDKTEKGYVFQNKKTGKRVVTKGGEVFNRRFNRPKFLQNFTPTTAREIALEFFATGGRLHTDDLERHLGQFTREEDDKGRKKVTRGKKEFNSMLWARSDKVRSVDEIAQELSGYGESNIDEGELQQELLNVAQGGKKAAFEELRRIAQPQEQTEEQQQTTPEEQEREEAEAATEELTEEEQEDVSPEDIEAVDVTYDNLTDEERSQLEAAIAEYTDENGVVDYVQILVDKTSGFSPVLLNLPEVLYNNLESLINEYHARQSENAATENVTSQEEGNAAETTTNATTATGEEIRPPGVNEQHLDERIADAREEVRLAEQALEDKKAELGRNINEAQPQLFEQPGAENQLFQTEVNVGQQNIDAILQPFQARIATAQRRLEVLEDPAQREQARDLDSRQLSIDVNNVSSQVNYEDLTQNEDQVSENRVEYQPNRPTGDQVSFDEWQEAQYPKYYQKVKTLLEKHFRGFYLTGEEIDDLAFLLIELSKREYPHVNQNVLDAATYLSIKMNGLNMRNESRQAEFMEGAGKDAYNSVREVHDLSLPDDAEQRITNGEPAVNSRKLNAIIAALQKAFPNIKAVTDKTEMFTAWNSTKKKGEMPSAFVHNGVVYLNPETVNNNTAVHEFGHIWETIAKEFFPELYAEGLGLIAGTEYEAAVRDHPGYSHLNDEGVAREALAEAIGDQGAKLKASAFEKFKDWLKRMYEAVSKALGIRTARLKQLSDPNYIANLKLEQFARKISKQLLGGKAISNLSSEELAVIYNKSMQPKSIETIRENISQLIANSTEEEAWQFLRNEGYLTAPFNPTKPIYKVLAADYISSKNFESKTLAAIREGQLPEYLNFNNATFEARYGDTNKGVSFNTNTITPDQTVTAALPNEVKPTYPIYPNQAMKPYRDVLRTTLANQTQFTTQERAEASQKLRGVITDHLKGIRQNRQHPFAETELSNMEKATHSDQLFDAIFNQATRQPLSQEQTDILDAALKITRIYEGLNQRQNYYLTESGDRVAIEAISNEMRQPIQRALQKLQGLFGAEGTARYNVLKYLHKALSFGFLNDINVQMIGGEQGSLINKILAEAIHDKAAFKEAKMKLAMNTLLGNTISRHKNLARGTQWITGLPWGTVEKHNVNFDGTNAEISTAEAFDIYLTLQQQDVADYALMTQQKKARIQNLEQQLAQLLQQRQTPTIKALAQTVKEALQQAQVSQFVLQEKRGKTIRNITRVTVDEAALAEIAGIVRATPHFQETIDDFNRIKEFAFPEVQRINELISGSYISAIPNYHPVTLYSDNISEEGYEPRIVEDLRQAKHRIGGANQIAVGDVYQKMQSYINATSHYSAFALPVRNARMVLFNLKEQGLFDGGNEIFYKRINDYLADNESLAKLNKFTTASKIFNRIMNKFYLGVLGWNVWVAPKQTVSYLSTVAMLGNAKYGKYIIDTINIAPAILKQFNAGTIRNAEFNEMIDKNPISRIRFYGLMNQELGELLHSGTFGDFYTNVMGGFGGTIESSARKAGRWYIRNAMNLIRSFDTGVVFGQWKAAKQYVIDKTGMTEQTHGDVYWDEVVHLHNQLVRESQSTYDMANRAAISRTEDPIVRSLNMFASQPIKNFNLMAKGLLQWYMQDDPAAKAAAKKFATKAMVNLMVYQSALLAFIDIGRDAILGYDDDDEVWRAALGRTLAYSFGNMPFGNVYSTQIANLIAQSHNFTQPQTTPIYDLINIGGEAIENMRDGDFEAVAEKLLTDGTKYLGIPTRPFKDTKAIIDNY